VGWCLLKEQNTNFDMLNHEDVEEVSLMNTSSSMSIVEG